MAERHEIRIIVAPAVPLAHNVMSDGCPCTTAGTSGVISQEPRSHSLPPGAISALSWGATLGVHLGSMQSQVLGAIAYIPAPDQGGTSGMAAWTAG